MIFRHSFENTSVSLDLVLVDYEDSGMMPNHLTAFDECKNVSNIANATDTNALGGIDEAEAIADLKRLLVSMVDSWWDARMKRPAVNTRYCCPIYRNLNNEPVECTHGSWR
mmetsp:Transcript_39743/g.81749  ORF Transcript_39743/g.81749 Transcript_39743/m.81749 type:complete len:111 (+) Transcript_39743:307-639(+)